MEEWIRARHTVHGEVGLLRAFFFKCLHKYTVSVGINRQRQCGNKETPTSEQTHVWITRSRGGSQWNNGKKKSRIKKRASDALCAVSVKNTNKKYSKALLLILHPFPQVLSGTEFSPCVCHFWVFAGVCLAVSESQRWAGLGRGLPALGWEVCVLQLRALSLVCLSRAAGQAVIIQTGLWTGCCVVPTARVTSHTCTLSLCKVSFLKKKGKKETKKMVEHTWWCVTYKCIHTHTHAHTQSTSKNHTSYMWNLLLTELYRLQYMYTHTFSVCK